MRRSSAQDRGPEPCCAGRSRYRRVLHDQWLPPRRSPTANRTARVPAASIPPVGCPAPRLDRQSLPPSLPAQQQVLPPASPRRPLPPAKRTVPLPSFETLATTLPGIRVRERRCGTSVNYGNRPVTAALHRDGCGPVLARNRDRGRRAGAGGAALDRQLSTRLDRVRSAANHQLDLAGLDLPAAPHAPQGEMRSAQGEADEPGLSRGERDTAEAAQLLDRARH